MRIVIQRVSRAKVRIKAMQKCSIDLGFVVLLGIATDDDKDDVDWLVRKLSGLRVFEDEKGLMNRSVTEIDGDLMVISQFTLHASVKKGKRPSFVKAARPEQAIPLYELFVTELETAVGKKVCTGEFGAHMDVELVNDGPVTIVMDSKNRQ